MKNNPFLAKLYGNNDQLIYKSFFPAALHAFCYLKTYFKHPFFSSQLTRGTICMVDYGREEWVLYQALDNLSRLWESPDQPGERCLSYYNFLDACTSITLLPELYTAAQAVAYARTENAAYPVLRRYSKTQHRFPLYQKTFLSPKFRPSLSKNHPDTAKAGKRLVRHLTQLELTQWTDPVKWDEYLKDKKQKYEKQ